MWCETCTSIKEEVGTEKPVDYSSLKVYNCPTYVHVSSVDWSKLDSKSIKCFFLDMIELKDKSFGIRKQESLLSVEM